MKLVQKITIKQLQTLKQILSPKMLQSLKTMQLSIPDLLTHIDTESKDNPFLEITPSQHTYYSGPKSQLNSTDDNSDFLDYTSRFDHCSNIIDYVNAQLDLEHLTERDNAIAHDITEHLDARGYLPNFDTLRKQLAEKYQVQERKINDVLSIIHTMEPDGVGARTLKECLILQVQHYQFDTDDLQDLLIDLIKNHLDNIATKNYKKIATQMDIDEDDVIAMHTFIRENLTPNPGAMFANTPTGTNAHILPSFKVSISETNNLLIENLEEKSGPKINLVHQEHLINNPKLDDTSRQFLKERLQKAKDLVDAYTTRIDNLNKLITTIISHQEQFVRQGLIYLEPLLQKQIAQTLGFSHSTISRIVSSKFIDTPHGIFPLKQLCPRNISGKTAARLKLIIQEIACQYPHYSDDQIKHHLQSLNITIARRTVTKYRLASNTQASYYRKSTI